MLATDTNIIVRLLTQDDPIQYKQSTALFARETIFIPDTVILETEWVLRYVYKYRPAKIIIAFRYLFGLSNVHLRHEASVMQALDWHEKGLDFADAFHLAQSQHCQRMVTFDQKLVKRATKLNIQLVILPT